MFQYRRCSGRWRRDDEHVSLAEGEVVWWPVPPICSSCRTCCGSTQELRIESDTGFLILLMPLPSEVREGRGRNDARTSVLRAGGCRQNVPLTPTSAAGIRQALALGNAAKFTGRILRCGNVVVWHDFVTSRGRGRRSAVKLHANRGASKRSIYFATALAS